MLKEILFIGENNRDFFEKKGKEGWKEREKEFPIRFHFMFFHRAQNYATRCLQRQGGTSATARSRRYVIAPRLLPMSRVLTCTSFCRPRVPPWQNVYVF